MVFVIIISICIICLFGPLESLLEILQQDVVLFRWGLGRPCESVVKWSELICDAARGFRVAFLTRDTKLEHSRDSHTMLLSIPIAYMSKWQDIKWNLSTRSESQRRRVELNCKWDWNNVDLKCQTQRVRNIIIAITQSTLKWFYITTMYTRYNEQRRKPKKP